MVTFLFVFVLYYFVVLLLDLYVFFKLKPYDTPFRNAKLTQVVMYALAGPFLLPYVLLFQRERLMLAVMELHKLTKPAEDDGKESLSLLHRVSGFFVKH